MRRILIVSLILAATSAYAEHIWRAWCGNPPTPREVSFDTSAECYASLNHWRQQHNFHTCLDTKSGPVFDDGTTIAEVTSCEAVQRFTDTCSCRAEAVERETKKPARTLDR